MGRKRIEPDVDFVKKSLRRGGDTLKQCYQCATCSVVCELSTTEEPFPRRQMHWAQWGLKDRVLSDPGIWLCHQCHDCTLHCPRGARPSEVISSLRNTAVEAYSWPGFLARMAARPALLPILLVIPVLIVGITVLLFNKLDEGPAGPVAVEYARMYPHVVLNILFSLLAMGAFAGVMAGAIRYWKRMDAVSPHGPAAISIGALGKTLREILLHSRFAKCGTEKNRRISHLLVVGGFVGLLLTTGGAIIYIVFDLGYPMPFGDPVKIFGNLSGVAVLVGVAWMMGQRLFLRDRKLRPGTVFDWSFLGVLFAVTLTGAACEALRFAVVPAVAYPMYFVHLVLIFLLLIYAPYTKFAHVVYRATAMTHEMSPHKAPAGERLPVTEPAREEVGAAPV